MQLQDLNYSWPLNACLPSQNQISEHTEACGQLYSTGIPSDLGAFGEGGNLERCTIPGESQEVEDLCETDQLSRNSKRGPPSSPELGHPHGVGPPWHLGRQASSRQRKSTLQGLRPTESPGHPANLKALAQKPMEWENTWRCGAAGLRISKRGFFGAGWRGVGLAPEGGERGAGTLMGRKKGSEGQPNPRPAL